MSFFVDANFQLSYIYMALFEQKVAQSASQRKIQQIKKEDKHKNAIKHRETLTLHTIAVNKDFWMPLRPKVGKHLTAIHTASKKTLTQPVRNMK